MQQEKFVPTTGQPTWVKGSPLKWNIVAIDNQKKTADLVPFGGGQVLVRKNGVSWSDLRRTEDEVHAEIIRNKSL